MELRRTAVLVAVVTVGLLLCVGATADPTVPAYANERREHVTQLPNGKTPATAKQLAKLLMTNEKWNNKKQWQCLRSLWYAESRWDWKADNKYSSAYGIAQVLNTPTSLTPKQQILRGYKYINSRYTTPCNAWKFFKINNWY